MKKTLSTLVLAAGLFIAPVAMAELKVAVVDTQAVLTNANAAKSARDFLQKETEKAQKRVNDLEAKLVKQQEDLKAKRGVLSPEKFADEEEKLKKSLREFRTEAQNIQAGLERENANRRNRITDAIRAEIAAIAKEKGFNLVIAENLLLFNDQQNDITQEVLKRVNAKVK